MLSFWELYENAELFGSSARMLSFWELYENAELFGSSLRMVSSRGVL
jgi:hypothetical protein